MTTFEEIRRELEERNARLMEAYEQAKRRGRPLPVTREELARIEEICAAQPSAARPAPARAPVAPDWSSIRC